MKKFFVVLNLLFCVLSVNAGVKIDKIEPTDWYVGMKDPSLQLMVYGKDIRSRIIHMSYNLGNDARRRLLAVAVILKLHDNKASRNRTLAGLFRNEKVCQHRSRRC